MRVPEMAAFAIPRDRVTVSTAVDSSKLRFSVQGLYVPGILHLHGYDRR